MKVMFPENFKDMIPKVPKEIHHELHSREFHHITDAADRRIIYSKVGTLFTLQYVFYIIFGETRCKSSLINNRNKKDIEIDYFTSLALTTLNIAKTIKLSDEVIFTPREVRFTH